MGFLKEGLRSVSLLSIELKVFAFRAEMVNFGSRSTYVTRALGFLIILACIKDFLEKNCFRLWFLSANKSDYPVA
jgi:hypothetical protein